jgi:hypothetical protein
LLQVLRGYRSAHCLALLPADDHKQQDLLALHRLAGAAADGINSVNNKFITTEKQNLKDVLVYTSKLIQQEVLGRTNSPTFPTYVIYLKYLNLI